MFIKNWDHALRLYNNGRLSGDDLILYADQMATQHVYEARQYVAMDKAVDETLAQLYPILEK